MAFTPAHALAALPVARSLGRARPVVFAALVLGTMAPDAPYFVPVPLSRDVTHSVGGVLGPDALVSLVALVVWLAVVERPVRDLSPTSVRERLGPPTPRARWSDVPLAYLAVVVGGLTHIVWDAFTHAGGWFVEHLPALRVVHGQWAAYQWLQLGTSVIGCVAVTVHIVRTMRARRPHPPPARVAPWHRLGWGLLVAGFLGGVLLGMGAMPPGVGRAEMLKRLVVPGLALTGVAVAVLVAVWWLTTVVRAVSASRRPRGAPCP